MIWQKLAQEFLVTGTVGDLICIAFGGFVIGVSSTIVVYCLWKLSRQLKGKMKTKILVSMFVLLAAAGCASMQTEIIAEPGRIDSITVGHFTTANPVNGKLFASYLRSELSICGFQVIEDSPYTLSGTIEFSPGFLGFGEINLVCDGNIVLRKNSEERLVVWFYEDRFSWRFSKSKGRKDFASYMAQEITKTLK